MKNPVIFMMLPFLILMIVQVAHGQEKKPFDPLKDDINQRIPPLQVLLDSASVRSPMLKYNQLAVNASESNLLTAKRRWMQNWGVQANYGYGTFDYIYNNTLGTTNPQTYTTKQTTSQYGVGAFLRIPFSDFIDRGNQIRMGKVLVQEAESQVAEQKRLVREEVITRYNDLIAKQKVFRVQSKYLETARINMQMAEKQFVNGSITVDNYSRVSEFSSRTEQDYETSKMAFITAYMLLEEFTGMKFNLY
jgi:outer membrane protein TolC